MRPLVDVDPMALDRGLTVLLVDDLADVPDEDTVRVQMIIEAAIAAIHENGLPADIDLPAEIVIAGLERMVARGYTAGQLRAHCRENFADLARGSS